MTDKEQIIIDGVDVSKCQYYNKNIKMDCLLYPLQPDSCSKNPNCNFKQLARKTQECEDLKKQLMRKDEINTFFNSPIEGWSSDPCGICKYKDEYSRYRKALEEIEEAIATYSSKHQYSIANDLYNQILDIINKAKGD